mmetsp:Transcript_3019/g.4834  ORF Transcript_3019/g.4834 Transcript_3019/m.4834 type:complete len:129 (-) Transcript_3019:327-713(-)
MSAIAASSFSLAASSKARGLGFRSSAPMGNRGGCAAAAVPIQPSQKHGRGSLQVVAGNKNEGGLFAPAVVISRNIVGVKKFNAFRGKIIALHSQVITEFCKEIGADSKLRQGLIKTAKNNGGRLGFLA